MPAICRLPDSSAVKCTPLPLPPLSSRLALPFFAAYVKTAHAASSSSCSGPHPLPLHPPPIIGPTAATMATRKRGLAPFATCSNDSDSGHGHNRRGDVDVPPPPPPPAVREEYARPQQRFPGQARPPAPRLSERTRIGIQKLRHPKGEVWRTDPPGTLAGLSWSTVIADHWSTVIAGRP